MGNLRFCLHYVKNSVCKTKTPLAGHSSIETTHKYYLSVGQSDMAMAREIQSKLLTSLTNYGWKITIF